MKCKVIPCDQVAVATSFLGVPVCLKHGKMLGGYTLIDIVWEYEKQRLAKEAVGEKGGVR